LARILTLKEEEAWVYCAIRIIIRVLTGGLRPLYRRRIGQFPNQYFGGWGKGDFGFGSRASRTGNQG